MNSEKDDTKDVNDLKPKKVESEVCRKKSGEQGEKTDECYEI